MMGKEYILEEPALQHGFSSYLDLTLDEYLVMFAQQHADKILMLDNESEQSLTGRELVKESLALAAWLKDTGVKYGEVVGIICDNCVQYIVIILAILRANCIVTTFNPLYTPGEFQHVLEISKPTILFVSERFLEKIENLRTKLPFISHIVTIKGRKFATSLPDTLPASELIKFQHAAINLRDIALILYSSGTTGYPKGVAVTHTNVVYVLELTRIGIIPTVIGDSLIETVPMFNGYGTLVNFLSVVIGFTLVIMKQFSEEKFLSYIELYKVKFLYMVPPLAVLLAKSKTAILYDLSSVEEIMCGGAPLSTEILNDMKNRLPNLRFIYRGYGMTETSFTGITSRKNQETKPHSCGRLLPGMKCKVVDLTDDRILGPMSIGELYLAGPNVMKCYYRNPTETEKIINSEGWLRTGDVGYYDEDGNVFIVDRVKELIKYKAHQVAPAEIENLLLQHKDVIDAAVVGIPDVEAGELPKAFVVKKPNSFIGEQDIIHYISDHVAPHKKIRGGVTFVDNIPKNPSGKILRRILKEWTRSKL